MSPSHGVCLGRLPLNSLIKNSANASLYASHSVGLSYVPYTRNSLQNASSSLISICSDNGANIIYFQVSNHLLLIGPIIADEWWDTISAEEYEGTGPTWPEELEEAREKIEAMISALDFEKVTDLIASVEERLHIGGFAK